MKSYASLLRSWRQEFLNVFIYPAFLSHNWDSHGGLHFTQKKYTHETR